MVNLVVLSLVIVIGLPQTTFSDWIATDLQDADGLIVERIRFAYRGDKLIKNGTLRAAMRTREGERLVRQAFNEDIVTVVNLYQSRGYRTARVARKLYQVNSKGNRVRILIDIDSGPIWNVASVSVVSEQTEMNSKLKGLISLRQGMPLDYGRVLEGERSIQVFLNRLGYPHAKVRNEWVEENAHRHDAIVVYHVETGPKMYFGDVEIENLENLYTKTSLVLSYLRFQRGELYDPQKLALARNELARTDLFRSVLLTTPVVSIGDSVQPIVVRLQERKYRQLSANLLVNSTQNSFEPRLTGSAEHANWLGRGMGLGLHASWGRPLQGVTLTFTERDIMRTAADWIVTMGLNEEWGRKRVFANPDDVEQFKLLTFNDSVLNRLLSNTDKSSAEEYIRNATYDYESLERLWDIRSVLSRRWHGAYQAQIALSYSQAYHRPNRSQIIIYEPGSKVEYSAPQLVVGEINSGKLASFQFDSFDPVALETDYSNGSIFVDGLWESILSERSRSVSLECQLLRDTRDDRIAPTRGLFLRFAGLYALELGGVETSVIDTEAEIRLYKRLTSRYVFAFAIQGMRTLSLRADRPLPQIYWKEYGGEGSLRGVDRNVIQVAGGGRIGLNLRTELRWEWSQLGAVLFWDRAQVWRSFRDLQSDDLRGMVDGIGLGLRYTYGFPFRLDLAFNDGFDPIQRTRFYFSIGQAF